MDLKEQLTDEELASKVQAGDTESFGFLVERYEPKLKRYGTKFISNRAYIEDLVQDIFIKVYTNIQSFNTKMRFSPWIYRIAHNEFVNAIKKRVRTPLSFFDLDEVFPHLTSNETADGEAAESETKRMMDDCLDKLDSKYREPLILYYYEDMDYQEIAEIMHIPISTVGVRINRGKKLLRKIFDDRFKK